MKMTMTVEYPFDKYVCGVTGLICCGCSLFCEHRIKNQMRDSTNKESEGIDNYIKKISIDTGNNFFTNN